jgi:hypothetical protein
MHPQKMHCSTGLLFSFCNFHWCNIDITAALAQPCSDALRPVPGHQPAPDGAAVPRARRK